MNRIVRYAQTMNGWTLFLEWEADPRSVRIITETRSEKCRSHHDTEFTMYHEKYR